MVLCLNNKAFRDDLANFGKRDIFEKSREAASSLKKSSANTRTTISAAVDLSQPSH